MTRPETTTESLDDDHDVASRPPLESVTRQPDLLLVIGGIVLSLVAIPATVLSLLTVSGPPVTQSGLVATGLLAMTPGIAMGTVALWLAARG